MRLFHDYFPDYYYATDYWPLIPTAIVGVVVTYKELDITALSLGYDFKARISQNYQTEAEISAEHDLKVKARVRIS